MARVAGTIVKSATGGAALGEYTAFVAGSNNGVEFDNSGKDVLLLIDNGNAAAVLSVIIPNTVDGVTVGPKTINLLANTDYVLGPFPPGIYNNTAGKVSVDCDVTTTAYKLVQVR